MATRGQMLQIQQDAMNGVRTGAQMNFVAFVKAAAQTQASAMTGMLRTIGATFDELQSGPTGPLFQAAHQQVGEAAVRSAAQGFTSRRFRRAAGRYRQGDDRLSGKLGAALRNTSVHVRATRYTISVFNTAYLDKEAAHWRRLNFGAGGGGREGLSPPEQFPMTWGGVVLATIGLEFDPRPGFRVPRGYWMNGGQSFNPAADRMGMDQFFLARSINSMEHGPANDAKMSRGIASRNFMDAGVRRLSNELPRAYEQLYRDIWDTQRASLQQAAAAAGVKAVRPAPQQIQVNWRRGASRRR